MEKEAGWLGVGPAWSHSKLAGSQGLPAGIHSLPELTPPKAGPSVLQAGAPDFLSSQED